MPLALSLIRSLCSPYSSRIHSPSSLLSPHRRYSTSPTGSSLIPFNRGLTTPAATQPITTTTRSALPRSTTELLLQTRQSIAQLPVIHQIVRQMATTTSKGKLYAHQATLPMLPVPSLEETVHLFLSTLPPLATSPEELERTTTAATQLLTPGGMGAILQQRLLDRRASRPESSWLIEWWNSYAYMAYRDPIVINVSYFFAFADDKQRRDMCSRAASLITGALEFKTLVASETLEPESTKKGPLCSHQYRYMFNSCRIPELPEDQTRSSDLLQNQHVIVMRKNKFYRLDTLHPGSNRRLTTAELDMQLNKIVAAAGDRADPAVGAFTTENRDVWAKIRKELISLNSQNKASLDTIETAAFVVCLDDTQPMTKAEIARACWHGDGRNRFFDKSLQFLVFENGKAGFNGEHSMMDATPTSRLCDFICDNIAHDRFDHGPATVDAVAAASLPNPSQLPFTLTSGLQNALHQAEAQLDSVIAKHDVNVVTYEGYGKNLIKTFGLSPDAFAQMAIQLAQYKLHGKVVATYESAQTKKFRHGRTEVCRSLSTESLAWVKAMEDPNIPLSVKGELGRKAIAAQSGYMAKAVEGKGVDRHFLGLKMLLQPGEEVPALFTDPLFKRSSYWALSTSQVTSEHYVGYGWGEVVPDGYGIAYMVKNNSLHFNIACLKEMRGHHLHACFHEALAEMRAVFEASSPSSTPLKAKL